MHVVVLQRKQTSEQKYDQGKREALHNGKEVKSPRTHNDPVLCASTEHQTYMKQKLRKLEKKQQTKPTTGNLKLSSLSDCYSQEKRNRLNTIEQTAAASSSPMYTQSDSQKKEAEQKNFNKN